MQIGIKVEKDYKDLLIQLLLEKMEKQPPVLLTASAVTTARPKIKKTRRNYGSNHSWTEEEYKFVADAVKAGHTHQEISHALGLRSKQVVAAIYRLKHGVYGVPQLLQELL
jgi:hypothetical protein